MSTPRADLLNFLNGLPGLNAEGERKALIDFMGYAHLGIYLDWSGAQVHFAEALIDEVSRRGQTFTGTFLSSMQRAPQVSVDKQAQLEKIRDRIVALSPDAWQQEFPTEPLTDQDRTALVADPEMLAATVVSTMLLPYYAMGAEQMKAAAGARAAAAAARVEATVSGNPVVAATLAMFKQNPEQSEASFLTVLLTVLRQDPALAKAVADDLIDAPAETDAALQAMVKVAQNIRTVKDDVVGALVGQDVLKGIGVHVDIAMDIDSVEEGGTVVGAVIGSAGSEVNIGGQHRHGPTYAAGSTHTEQDVTVTGEGAAAVGPGAVAAGKGGLAVGGSISGDVVTGGSSHAESYVDRSVSSGGDMQGSTVVTGDENTTVQTGGGAFVGGSVTTGGDFVGRDRITAGDSSGTGVAVGRGASATVQQGVSSETVNVGNLVIYQGEPLVRGQVDRATSIDLGRTAEIEESIRLDVVAPRRATLREPFDLGVAVRQPESPPLSVDDVEQVASATGHIFRTEQDEVVDYRVEVRESGSTIVPDHYVLRLRHGADSPVYYFQITPNRPGVRSLLINAYQVKDSSLAAQSRITIQVEVPVQPGT